MVFVNLRWKSLFSATVGGLVSLAALNGFCLFLERGGHGFDWGEAILIYLRTIAGAMVSFEAGAICAGLMPFSTSLKGMGVVVADGLAGICALVWAVGWLL